MLMRITCFWHLHTFENRKCWKKIYTESMVNSIPLRTNLSFPFSLSDALWLTKKYSNVKILLQRSCVRNTSVKHVKFAQADSGRLPIKFCLWAQAVFRHFIWTGCNLYAVSSSFLLNRPWVSEIHLSFTRRFK